ncbi:hypothetical protein PSPO01_04303 [Paraphaeosphaeria sporulosa]
MRLPQSIIRQTSSTIRLLCEARRDENSVRTGDVEYGAAATPSNWTPYLQPVEEPVERPWLRTKRQGKCVASLTADSTLHVLQAATFMQRVARGQKGSSIRESDAAELSPGSDGLERLRALLPVEFVASSYRSPAKPDRVETAAQLTRSLVLFLVAYYVRTGVARPAASHHRLGSQDHGPVDGCAIHVSRRLPTVFLNSQRTHTGVSARRKCTRQKATDAILSSGEASANMGDFRKIRTSRLGRAPTTRMSNTFYTRAASTRQDGCPE